MRRLATRTATPELAQIFDAKRARRFSLRDTHADITLYPERQG